MSRTELILSALALAGTAVGFVFAHWIDAARRERGRQ